MKKIIFITMLTVAIASCGDNTTDNTRTDSSSADSGSSGMSSGSSNTNTETGGSSTGTDTGMSGSSQSTSPTGVSNGIAPTTGVGADSVDMGSSKGVQTQTGSSKKSGSKTDPKQ